MDINIYEDPIVASIRHSTDTEPDGPSEPQHALLDANIDAASASLDTESSEDSQPELKHGAAEQYDPNIGIDTGNVPDTGHAPGNTPDTGIHPGNDLDTIIESDAGIDTGHKPDTAVEFDTGADPRLPSVNPALSSATVHDSPFAIAGSSWLANGSSATSTETPEQIQIAMNTATANKDNGSVVTNSVGSPRVKHRSADMDTETPQPIQNAMNTATASNDDGSVFTNSVSSPRFAGMAADFNPSAMHATTEGTGANKAANGSGENVHVDMTAQADSRINAALHSAAASLEERLQSRAPESAGHSIQVRASDFVSILKQFTF